MELFEQHKLVKEPFVKLSSTPLAERVRPAALGEFVGQRQLLGEGKTLKVLIERDEVPSMIFWGPPGCGKTTLARIIATQTKAEFYRSEEHTSELQSRLHLV